MGGGLTVFFDFASPYAYAGFDEACRIARQADISLNLRPVMVWVILDRQGIVPPLDVPARRAYMLGDMARSAAFFGRPYRQPEPLAISAHKASRMWLGLAQDNTRVGIDLARAIYHARFVEGLDIRDTDVLIGIAAACGHPRHEAQAALDAEGPRASFEDNHSAAIACGAPGVPYFVLNGEGFFGADRLSHLRYRLGLAAFDPGRRDR